MKTLDHSIPQSQSSLSILVSLLANNQEISLCTAADCPAAAEAAAAAAAAFGSSNASSIIQFVFSLLLVHTFHSEKVLVQRLTRCRFKNSNNKPCSQHNNNNNNNNNNSTAQLQTRFLKGLRLTTAGEEGQLTEGISPHPARPPGIRGLPGG